VVWSLVQTIFKKMGEIRKEVVTNPIKWLREGASKDPPPLPATATPAEVKKRAVKMRKLVRMSAEALDGHPRLSNMVHDSPLLRGLYWMARGNVKKVCCRACAGPHGDHAALSGSDGRAFMLRCRSCCRVTESSPTRCRLCCSGTV
jgi:hypothetical protein